MNGAEMLEKQKTPVHLDTMARHKSALQISQKIKPDMFLHGMVPNDQYLQR